MSDDETIESLIPYDAFVQDALRQAVAAILSNVAVAGLPGAHHFFIGFRTRHPGVVLPPALLERYPDEMTIVLQHRFWDLQVDEDQFEVGISFNQVPTKIVVPFAALVSFVDPSVGFGLQFQTSEEADRAGDDEAGGDGLAGSGPQSRIGSDDKTLPPAAPAGGATVVSLDKFRKK